MKKYAHHGIYFAYPENWILEESDMGSTDGMLQLTNSTGAFWILKKYPFGTNPESIASEAAEAMQSEYDDIEVVRFEKNMHGKAVTGFEMTFFYLDLMNLAAVFCFEQDGQTLAVFWQTGNQLIVHNEEAVPVEDVLAAVTETLLRGSDFILPIR